MFLEESECIGLHGDRVEFRQAILWLGRKFFAGVIKQDNDTFADILKIRSEKW